MMFASAPAVIHVPDSWPGLDDHPRPGGGRGVTVDDADLVVHQVHAVESGVERAERLAEGEVERLNRPVAVGGGVEDLTVDLDLHARLGARRRPLRRSTMTVKSTIRNGGA